MKRTYQWLKSMIALWQLNYRAWHPAKTQYKLLQRILSENKNTVFGKEYIFHTIDSYETFKKRVPIHTYEKLEPYIQQQMCDRIPSLTSEHPILYAQTSGTEKTPKYIPILEKTIRAYKKAQDIFSYIEARDVPDIFSGKILAIVSPAVEGYCVNNIPYGSMSGIVYKNMPDNVRDHYILPAEIFEVDDYELKYLLIIAFAIAEKDISVLATANPSTFLRLKEVLVTHTEQLIAYVATGDLSILHQTIDASLINKLANYCNADNKRADQLRAILQREQWRFTDIWPSLKAVVTWTKGNCALLIPQLKKLLSNEVVIIEMGYLCSEFRGTITIDCINNLQLPVIDHLFFEFIEAEQWLNNNTDTLTIEQIEQGKRYYIVVTAPHGLYRYFINDIIEVTGRHKNTPTIAFVQKGKGITNLTGEKLYENQVIGAVKEVCAAHLIEPHFFMMLADQQLFSYTLYIEANHRLPEHFVALFKEALAKLNIEYQAKLKSGRIKFIGIKQLKAGTFEQFKKHCLNTGQREGQFKLIKLQYLKDITFVFDDHVEYEHY